MTGLQPSSKLLLLGAIAVLVLSVQGYGASLLLCGGDEVFLINPAQVTNGDFDKLWSWRAKDHDELPAALRGQFATTDDCKPIEGGAKVLISSSGGGCALVKYPGGHVLWHAHVPNAHTMELFPGDRVIAASSHAPSGDRLILFDLAASDKAIWEMPLSWAHGLSWDEKRHRLWALGYDELRCYELMDWRTEKPSLHLQATYQLPDNEGHELQALPTGDDLIVSTGKHVYLFDRETLRFRPDPDLANQNDVKSISFEPVGGRMLYMHGEGDQWWSNTLHLLAPVENIELPKETLYKARWMPEAEKK